MVRGRRPLAVRDQRYDSDPNAYLKIMESYPELPLVITEWGGRVGQGNPAHPRRTVRDVRAPRTGGAFGTDRRVLLLGVAGLPGTHPRGAGDRRRLDDRGVDRPEGKPRHDLLALSLMCFEIDRPPVREAGQPRVLLPGPRRAPTWAQVDLGQVTGDQAALEQEIEQARAVHGVTAPVLGPLLVDGIEFTPRHPQRRASPLLIGRGREEAIIPVNRRVQAIAVLGHVDFAPAIRAPASSPCTPAERWPRALSGRPASEYRFEFDDGTVAEPLRHGEHILRGNVICRWWRSDPRAPFTRGAIEAVLHPSYEILRIDLWEKRFERPRLLRRIRWRLQDERVDPGNVRDERRAGVSDVSPDWYPIDCAASTWSIRWASTWRGRG